MNLSQSPCSHVENVENVEKSEIVLSPVKNDTSSKSIAPQLAAAKKHLYPNYAQPDLIMDRGQGSVLFDSQGKRYVDFFAGIAVSTLGHAHPKMVSALSHQAGQLMHLSNYFYTAPNIELAEQLCRLAKMDRVLFCNSGTEANEAALKLARHHFFMAGQTERDVVIAFDNSFHGRTMGALTATGQPKYREGFGPIGGVVHVPFGDLSKVREVMSDRTSAIICEPVQGEGGVIPAPPGFLQGLREICDESGALLILDEIQTGVGRTGGFLAWHDSNVKPDIVSMAKALGGGFPIGAMLCSEALSGALPPGSHGTTYGGNPLASCAAKTVLEVYEQEGLQKQVALTTAALEEALDKLVDKHECLTARRGAGLLQGLVLADPTQGGRILAALRDAGLLVTFAGGVVIRITPPLNISKEELEEGLTLLDQVLGDES